MKTFLKITIVIMTITFISCLNNDDYYTDYQVSTTLSIFSNQGKLGMSVLINDKNHISTEFFIDGEKVGIDQMKEFLPASKSFRTSIDKNYLATTISKNINGELNHYQFYRQYTLNPSNQLFYLKNGKRLNMDTVALGAIHAVDASNGEVFSGFFGRRYFSETSEHLSPNVAFYWDGTSKPKTLPIPTNYIYFRGVGSITKYEDDIYTIGLMEFPMYWKNTEVVSLANTFGEVNQIKVINGDVYAVGFYNKNNSNSTNHTACYWKNGVLVELENGAIAYSIDIEDDTVYVSGAKGLFGTDYKACYWVNGELKMLNL